MNINSAYATKFLPEGELFEVIKALADPSKEVWVDESDCGEVGVKTAQVSLYKSAENYRVVPVGSPNPFI